jgi:predicted Rossmann-fold nucleotide-binding protein
MNATQLRQTSAERFVCVFCASSNGTDPIFLEAAKALGQAIAERRRRLVYGGAEVGLMARWQMLRWPLAAGSPVSSRGR